MSALASSLTSSNSWTRMHTCREAEADRIPFLGDVEPLANLREGRNFCGHVAYGSSSTNVG